MESLALQPDLLARPSATVNTDFFSRLYLPMDGISLRVLADNLNDHQHMGTSVQRATNDARR